LHLTRQGSLSSADTESCEEVTATAPTNLKITYILLAAAVFTA